MLASSESLWAEHGLTGLVLFAMFGLIGVFIHVISKKDRTHSEFISTMMTEERNERKESRDSNERNNERLASAIVDLTDELRSENRRTTRQGQTDGSVVSE